MVLYIFGWFHYMTKVVVYESLLHFLCVEEGKTILLVYSVYITINFNVFKQLKFQSTKYFISLRAFKLSFLSNIASSFSQAMKMLRRAFLAELGSYT